MCKANEEIHKRYTKGKKLTSVSKVGEFEVRVYGELDVERLVKRLLKSKYITK